MRAIAVLYTLSHQNYSTVQKSSVLVTRVLWMIEHCGMGGVTFEDRRHIFLYGHKGREEVVDTKRLVALDFNQSHMRSEIFPFYELEKVQQVLGQNTFFKFFYSIKNFDLKLVEIAYNAKLKQLGYQNCGLYIIQWQFRPFNVFSIFFKLERI